MKIAVFASAYAPHVGGVEQLVRKLAIEYRDVGHEAFIVTNRWPRDLPALEVIDGIRVYRPALRWPVGPPKARASYLLTHRRILRQVCRIVQAEGADVLHVQCVSANGLYAMRCKQRLHLPLVVTAQGELTMDAQAIYQRYGFVSQLLDDVANEADVFTACSAKTLADIEAYLGRSLGLKARVIHNGADPREFRRVTSCVSQPAYLLAIGRLVPQKGFDVLLEAYARVRPPQRVVIAGEGPERAALERLVTLHRLTDCVTFTGGVDRDRAAALYLGSDFVVVPSTADEGLPLVVIEAMAAGRAIVVSQTGGVLEAVVPEESAIVVPMGDVVSLATAIERVGRDRSLRERLGEAASQEAERFTWTSLAQQYLNAFAETLDAPGPASCRS